MRSSTGEYLRPATALLVVLLAGLQPPALPGQERARRPHLVPAAKKLPRAWWDRLYEKGASRVYRGPELATIGMPVGGIGAGQLYLLGDGTLGCWQIFKSRSGSLEAS